MVIVIFIHLFHPRQMRRDSNAITTPLLPPPPPPPLPLSSPPPLSLSPPPPLSLSPPPLPLSPPTPSFHHRCHHLRQRFVVVTNVETLCVIIAVVLVTNRPYNPSYCSEAGEKEWKREEERESNEIGIAIEQEREEKIIVDVWRERNKSGKTNRTWKIEGRGKREEKVKEREKVYYKPCYTISPEQRKAPSTEGRFRSTNRRSPFVCLRRASCSISV